MKFDYDQSSMRNNFIVHIDFGVSLDLIAKETNNHSQANHDEALAFCTLCDWQAFECNAIENGIALFKSSQ